MTPAQLAILKKQDELFKEMVEHFCDCTCGCRQSINPVARCCMWCCHGLCDLSPSNIERDSQ